MAARFTFIALMLLTTVSPLLAADTGPDNLMIAKFDDKANKLYEKRQEATRRLLINEDYEYYDIQGGTAEELRQQMRQSGTKWNDGKVYAALTSWDISYNFDVDSSGGRYFIKSADTKIGIVFHFPRRIGAAGEQSVVATQWSKYMENLKVHENGHRDLAVKAAGEINEILATLGSFATKEELEREAERRVQAKLKAMKAAQVDYDHDTNHGIKQGAVLSAL